MFIASKIVHAGTQMNVPQCGRKKNSFVLIS